MAIKKYNVEHYPTRAEIEVEIDFSYTLTYGTELLTMDDLIKQLVEFWAGWKSDLAYNNGNYIQTFLKNLCDVCLKVALEGNWNKDGVISEFEGKEGWCSLDGSNGVKLISLSGIDLSDHTDYGIKEI